MAAPADLDVEQAILDYEEAREKKKNRIKIFGRNFSEIPCFRESFMYGILGGIGVGLGYFLFTSRVGRAVDTSVYSFAGITLCNWCYCRYDKAKHLQELLRFKHELHHERLTEGVANPVATSEPIVFDEAVVITPKRKV